MAGMKDDGNILKDDDPASILSMECILKPNKIQSAPEPHDA
jgi:hypothetical protein